jgi:single-strand DNA-binding protein
MQGINLAIIVGTLGADPETRYFPDGNGVTSLSVATNEKWKDKITGEPQERTEWHRVSIFGPLADIAAQYLRKGSQVYLEGQIRTRKWQAQDGSDRWSTEIVLQGPRARMQMLGGPRTDGQRQQSQSQSPSPSQPSSSNDYASATGRSSRPPQAGGEGQKAPFDDDIPF